MINYAENHALDDLDGCKIFMLVGSLPPGTLLCWHEKTDRYPVSFILVYCPNDCGDFSETQSYKMFGAVMYHTELFANYSSSKLKSTGSEISMSIETNAQSLGAVKPFYEGLSTSLKNGDALWKEVPCNPYREIRAEAESILNDCKENHFPMPKDSNK